MKLLADFEEVSVLGRELHDEDLSPPDVLRSSSIKSTE